MSDKGKEKDTEGGPSQTANSKKSKDFRINALGFYLTYPKCSLTPEEALSKLREICQKKTRAITEYLISSEKHQDGTDHIHAWIKLNKSLNVRSPTLFDLNNHHDNYQAARNANRVKKYCAKDGNYIADPPYVPTTKETPWKTAMDLAKAGQVEEALDLLATGGERSCRDLILHSTAILTSFQRLAPVKPLPCALDLTSYGNLFEWDRTKYTLVICGATNLGKTTLAASLLPKALFTRHLDLLGDLTTKHEGIILDDMSFKHLHDEGQIALIDTAMTTQVHVRYKVAIIPAGLPRIVTTNKSPYDVFNINNPAIARRLLCITWHGWDSNPKYTLC